MRGWPAFWLLCACFVAAEAFLTSRGLDTFLWQYQTPAELELQRSIIKKAAE